MGERTAVDPEVHLGKPCVAGAGTPVLGVLELVSEGLAFDAIIQDYETNRSGTWKMRNC